MNFTFDKSTKEQIAKGRKVNSTIYQPFYLFDIIDAFCEEHQITRNDFFFKASIMFIESFEKKIREAA